MPSDVQAMQHDSSGTVDSAAIHSESTTTEETQAKTKRKRNTKRFRPEEVLVANQFKALGVDEEIKYSELTSEMRKAIMYNSKMRLVDRGILELEYDVESGRIMSVSVSSEKWSEYEDELSPEIAKAASRGVRNPILSDPKYKIIKLQEKNPRKEGSHGWYNWNQCYEDNMSVGEYLDFMEYDRDIKVKTGDRIAWFNGPSQVYLIHDVRKGYLGIYNVELAKTDESYWIKADQLVISRDAEDSDESDTLAQSGESNGNDEFIEQESVAVA